MHKKYHHRCNVRLPLFPFETSVENTNIGFAFQNLVNTMFGCGHWYSIIKKIMESQLWEEITLERGLSKIGQNHKNSQNPDLPHVLAWTTCFAFLSIIFLVWYSCHLDFPKLPPFLANNSSHTQPPLLLWSRYSRRLYNTGVKYTTIYIFWELGEL